MSLIAVVICPACEEVSDIVVNESMGATDLIPPICPYCEEPWPADILNDEMTDVR